MYNYLMDLETGLPSAHQALNAAFQALQQGDQRSARRYAEQAAALAPQMEEPWLLMAILASPKAAPYYISRAFQAHPGSPRAEAGARWLAKQPAEAINSNRAGLPAWLIFPESFKAPSPKTRDKFNFIWIIAIIAIVVVGLAAVGIPHLFAQSAAQEDPRVVSAVQTAIKAAEVKTASSTPSPTWTFEPSSTPTELPTATETALPTSTATSTSTATAKPSATLKPSPIPPTKTPAPFAYTVQRGDTLYIIAQKFKVTVQDLIVANEFTNPSLLMAGQVILIPAAGYKPPAALPTAVSVPSAGGKGKEIVIDISDQHMWAYENGKQVFSFVVSTGIYNSTRIGTFKVLDKIPNAYSSRFNIWMPYWMGIYYSGTLENGIHGLPLLWNGVELWGNLLGKPATYGCIEARTWEIKKLYDWAEIGIPVIIRR